MTPARLGGSVPRVFALLSAALIALALHASASSATTPRRQAPGSGRSNKVQDLPPVGWSQGPSLPQSYLTRWDWAYASFPPAHQVVLFGGSPKGSEGWRNDTWVFQDGAWSKGPVTPPNLSPRGGAAMGYDPAIGKIVLWAGSGPEWPPRFYGTWLWDGTGWSPGPYAPGSMLPRTGAEMVYDPDIGKMVLFGGSGVDAYTDTWLFDGTRWTAGPAPAQGMTSRTFFGMTYDESLHKVVVVGGDGANDVWYFDGTAWSAGPSLPSDFRGQDRVRIAYDPDLGGTLLFGGIGSGMASDDLWMLRGGAWTQITRGGSPSWPDPRADGALLWNPDFDALMLFGGIQSADPGDVMYTDTWFFRDSPPIPESLIVTPDDPNKDNTLTATAGAVDGGYGHLSYQYGWFVNDGQVQGADTNKLASAFGVNDRVQASLQVTDALGIAGPWVMSNTVQIADRPPDESGNSIVPSPAYPWSILKATVDKVTDPDGDSVTLHYVWQVNGQPIDGNDSATLTPDHFQEGDTVVVQITPVDQWGQAGPPGDTQTNIHKSLTVGLARPGASVNISGDGFGPREQVDVFLDQVGGPRLLTTTTDSNGSFPQKSMPVPAPLPGGLHHLFGVGHDSQIQAPGSMTVVPVGVIDPRNLVAGQTTTYTGMGFLPGETVSVAFPGGTPVSKAADQTGSVSVSLPSPLEPFPGGLVTASAPSGQTQESFSAQSRMTSPAQGSPKSQAQLSVTGFGASETVQVKFDGGQPVLSFNTDATGSGQTTLALPPTFGNHTITATGAKSKASRTNKISLAATVTLTPSSGPVGTVVTIDSGPGWIPASKVHLWWGGSKVADLVADATGKVHTTYTIPRHAPGSVNISLTDDLLKVTAKAPFRIV